MKKTFLKMGASALFCLFFLGFTQSAWAQNEVKDDAGVVTTTTVTKTFESDADDATVDVQRGTVRYRVFTMPPGKNAKWKEIKSGDVAATGSSATGTQKPKKQTLSAKGSHRMKVEVTIGPDANATIRGGKL